MGQAENNIKKAKKEHIDKINTAIYAIIDLEDYGPLPDVLCKSLTKLELMRTVVNEDIKEGDSFNNLKQIVTQVGVLNLFFVGGMSVGRKFCFKI